MEDLFEALYVPDEKMEVVDFTGLITDNLPGELNRNDNVASSHLKFEEMPHDLQYQLSAKYYQTGFELSARMALENQRCFNKCCEMREKERIAVAKEERQVETELNKEAETVRVYYGPDRAICAEICRPPGKFRRFTVIDQSEMKLEKIFSVIPSGGVKVIYCLKWALNTKGILIREKLLNAEGLVSVLQKNGISLNTSRRNHAIIVGKVLAMLHECCTVREVPYGFGWRKNISGEWHFISSFDGTFEEVEKNAEH